MRLIFLSEILKNFKSLRVVDVNMKGGESFGAKGCAIFKQTVKKKSYNHLLFYLDSQSKGQTFGFS